MYRFISLVIALAPLLSGQEAPAFRWVREVEASGKNTLVGVGTDLAGNSYLVGNSRALNFPLKNAVQGRKAGEGVASIFVMKLDAAGNTVYSTFFGGSGNDMASAMAVDAAGNVFVTGLTGSADFPVTRSAWLRTAPVPVASASSTFVFRLNGDGSVGYATYFSTNQTAPNAIAADSAGSAYLTGTTQGGLPVTPGAYQSVCNCPFSSNGFFVIPVPDVFLARLDAAGGNLLFATYLGVQQRLSPATAMALGADGSAYLGASTGIYRLDSAGHTLLASAAPGLTTKAMAMGRDGQLYLAGLPEIGLFRPTAGAFQMSSGQGPNLSGQGTGAVPAGLIKMDSELREVLAATYFGGIYGTEPHGLALDSAGNVFVGGATQPRGLPTRTPFVEAFANTTTGFVAELSGDLSRLLFSSYFGDEHKFGVAGIGLDAAGNLVLGGTTNGVQGPGNLWVNSVTIGGTGALRVDAVLNAASGLGDPLSPGETVVVQGAGFRDEAEVLAGGAALRILTRSGTRIVAVMPAELSGTYSGVGVKSGGADSNVVLAPVRATSPGLFSADGSGTGQGYILNGDGTRNTPENPAKGGERITIYATGVGRVGFTGGMR